jgi:hypothetical protein
MIPACIFGGNPGAYAEYDGPPQWGQHYAVASKANPTLTASNPPPGNSCVGDSLNDPIGATFSQIYNGAFFYVVWNDQFYDHPLPNSDAPWGHAKGIVAWDNSGNGMVMQVSTPSWPGSAKIGVSDSSSAKLSIFGDMNQQGTLVPVTPKKTKANPHPEPTCESSQNERGGTFYVLDDPKLFDSITSLLKGKTVPVPPH